MASVRFSDIIGKYVDYSTSGEFSVWVEKLELVAELQEVDDKLKFLPLFLSGPAFAVYQQLTAEVKKDYDKLKKELTTAFGTNPFASYEQLRSRVLSEGESVDVYLADLRRLVDLIGQKAADPLLRCAFVAGLPADIAIQLKSTVDVESMNLAELVSKARAMLASKCGSVSYVCAGVRQDRQAGVRQDSQAGVRRDSQAGTRCDSQAGLRQDNKVVQCFNCSGRGHVSRDCPSERTGSPVGRIRRCYVCDATTHLANKCPQRSGKGHGGVSASDAHPTAQQ